MDEIKKEIGNIKNTLTHLIIILTNKSTEPRLDVNNAKFLLKELGDFESIEEINHV